MLTQATSSLSPVGATSFDLSDRVAIVTGGSRGIGRAVALGFAAAGASVVVASRKQGACDRVASEIADAGGTALAVATHVGRADDLDALVAAVDDRFGAIDIVVNNAANPLGGPLAELTPLAFEKAYSVNVLGPVLLAQKALAHLRRSPHAAIINMITVGAFRGGAHLGLYCSSKAALWNLTGVMAKEWGPLGIRVNAIAPGPFDTDMMAATYAIPEFRDAVVDATVSKRIADPDEIVGAALLLASDAGSYMQGSVVTVDGGTFA
jgi:NAD(P)-dependent dehydrogenase (short-subunit alcohol dehydrogenase family)